MYLPPVYINHYFFPICVEVFYVSYFSGVYRLYSQENSLVTYFWNHCSAQTNVSIPGSNSKAINPLSAATLLHRALARLWQCTRPACVCVCVHCAVCKATSFQLCLLLMLKAPALKGGKSGQLGLYELNTEYCIVVNSNTDY